MLENNKEMLNDEEMEKVSGGCDVYQDKDGNLQIGIGHMDGVKCLPRIKRETDKCLPRIKHENDKCLPKK